MDIGFIGLEKLEELSKGFSKYDVNRIYAYDPLLISSDSENYLKSQRLTMLKRQKL